MVGQYYSYTVHSIQYDQDQMSAPGFLLTLAVSSYPPLTLLFSSSPTLTRLAMMVMPVLVLLVLLVLLVD